MAQAVKILPHGRHGLHSFCRSVPWLLMAWRCLELGIDLAIGPTGNENQSRIIRVVTLPVLTCMIYTLCAATPWGGIQQEIMGPQMPALGDPFDMLHTLIIYQPLLGLDWMCWWVIKCWWVNLYFGEKLYHIHLKLYKFLHWRSPVNIP